MQKNCSGLFNVQGLGSLMCQAGQACHQEAFYFNTRQALQRLECLFLHSIDQFQSLKKQFLSQTQYWSQDSSSTEQHLSRLHTQPALIHKALAQALIQANTVAVFMDSDCYGCAWFVETNQRLNSPCWDMNSLLRQSCQLKACTKSALLPCQGSGC